VNINRLLLSYHMTRFLLKMKFQLFQNSKNKSKKKFFSYFFNLSLDVCFQIVRFFGNDSDTENINETIDTTRMNSKQVTVEGEFPY
jgi:hypothetical protein